MPEELESADAIAERLKISRRQVYQLVEDGWLPRSGGEGFALIDCALGYIDYLRHRMKTESRGAENARVARARAVKLELENLRAMGELQPRVQVEETFDALVNIIRSSCEGLPGRLSSELASISEPPRIYQLLSAELRAITDRSADYLAKRADALEAVPPPDEDAASEGAGTTDEMGGSEPDDAGGFTGAGPL